MVRSMLWVAVLAVGCDRGQPREGTPAGPPAMAPVMPAAPTAAAPPPPGCTLTAIPLRTAAVKRLVAIGDLHGDLAATRSALKAAGAIDARDQWIGGELVIVQTGDVLDRGDDEQAILDLLHALQPQAKAAGGALILLLGNHELMNAAGDFRYVTSRGMSDFDDVAGLDGDRWHALPAVARKRFAALAPGGLYARQLAAHNVIAIVGDTVFSHGGVLGEWVTQVEDVNLASRCWLDGQAGGPETPPRALTSDDSPVWTRAAGTDRVDCAQVASALAALGVKRMVVGHTVQDAGITSACDGAVWRIDVGLARHYGGPIEVLELVPGGAPRVVRGAR